MPPLNISETATPDPIGSAQPVASSIPPVVAPTLPGVSASAMPPTIAAGVNLARIVLCITSAAIALFFVYLLLMEYEVAANVKDAYGSVGIQNRSGAEFEALSRFDRAAADIAAMQKDAALQPDAEGAKNIQYVLSLVGDIASLPAPERAQIKDCWPIPGDTTRAPKLETCGRVLARLRAVVVDAMTNASVLYAATERATKINEQRQTLHTFWIQAVQVILVNVLLPLLTALFGYIFGTQQGQRTGG